MRTNQSDLEWCIIMHYTCLDKKQNEFPYIDGIRGRAVENES